MDVTYHGFRAVKTPCGDQLPSHRRHFGQPARCRNNLMFQTAVSAKTICKSSLGQLLATEFDFILNLHAPTLLSAARMRISVVSNRAHEKRTFALTLRVRSSLLLFPQSWIEFGRWKLPLRRLLTTKRSVWANKRHALGISNPMTAGLMFLLPERTARDMNHHALVERTLNV